MVSDYDVTKYAITDNLAQKINFEKYIYGARDLHLYTQSPTDPNVPYTLSQPKEDVINIHKTREYTVADNGDNSVNLPGMASYQLPDNFEDLPPNEYNRYALGDVTAKSDNLNNFDPFDDSVENNKTVIIPFVDKDQFFHKLT
jgi:hypothetical protein